MSHEVFISYSSIDKEVADRLCKALEESGTVTWIAPRDVMPGKSYGEALIDAINDSKVMVLVLSEHSNHSSQVVREVERAASKGIPIIPFRIADVRLAKSLEYFLSTCHWLDALGDSVDEHLPRMTEAVNATLRAVYDGETLPLNAGLGDAAQPRARPASPRTKRSQAAAAAKVVEESVYLAEVVSACRDDQRQMPPSRPNAHVPGASHPQAAGGQAAPTGPHSHPHRPQQRRAPQYRPHAQRRQSGAHPRGNGLGVAGLTASIIGVFTCGTFSPIGLVLSLFALAKAPRGNAVAGTLVGAAGSVLFAMFFAYGFFSGFSTAVTLEDAAAEIDDYYYTAGDYPNEHEAADLLAGHEDAWDRPLRYQRNWPDGYEVRSAGFDGAFDTADDHALVR